MNPTVCYIITIEKEEGVAQLIALAPYLVVALFKICSNCESLIS